MSNLPLPKFNRTNRPEPSLDDILRQGQAAAAATGQIITGDIPLPPKEARPAQEPEAAKPDRPAKSRAKVPEPIVTDRVRWDARVKRTLWVQARKRALDQSVTPNDVLEAALEQYFANT